MYCVLFSTYYKHICIVFPDPSFSFCDLWMNPILYRPPHVIFLYPSFFLKIPSKNDGSIYDAFCLLCGAFSTTDYTTLKQETISEIHIQFLHNIFGYIYYKVSPIFRSVSGSRRIFMEHVKKPHVTCHIHFSAVAEIYDLCCFYRCAM